MNSITNYYQFPTQQNPMKATEVIAQLQKMIEEHGDLDVYYTDGSYFLDSHKRRPYTSDKMIYVEKRYESNPSICANGFVEAPEHFRLI